MGTISEQDTSGVCERKREDALISPGSPSSPARFFNLPHWPRSWNSLIFDEMEWWMKISFVFYLVKPQKPRLHGITIILRMFMSSHRLWAVYLFFLFTKLDVKERKRGKIALRYLLPWFYIDSLLLILFCFVSRAMDWDKWGAACAGWENILTNMLSIYWLNCQSCQH